MFTNSKKEDDTHHVVDLTNAIKEEHKTVAAQQLPLNEGILTAC